MEIEWNILLRLLVAGLLGGLVGFEREFRAKEAGIVHQSKMEDAMTSILEVAKGLTIEIS